MRIPKIGGDGCLTVYALFVAAGTIIIAALARNLDGYHTGLAVATIIGAAAFIIGAGINARAIADMQREQQAQPVHPHMLRPSPARLAHLRRVGRSPAIAHPTPPSLAQALASIPNALVLPACDDGPDPGVIVASVDPAFIDQVHAAVRRVPGHIHLIAGEAGPPPGEPESRLHYMWHSHYCNGRLHGREPRRRIDTGTLSFSYRHYWRIRPAIQPQHPPPARPHSPAIPPR